MHRAAAALATLSLLAASAVAQDGKSPGKPADPAKPEAPAAKKERKTSPEAEAALKRYVGLLHFPTSKHKTIEMSSHCDVQVMGGEVGCKFVLKDDGTVALDVTLPDAVRQQYGDSDEQLAGMKKAAAGMVGGMFKPFLVPADVVARQYDLVARVEGGKTIVDMAKFADDAAWDKASLVFGVDGLLEKQTGTPNVDPNDPNPMAAARAGTEIVTTIAHKKRGEFHTIESATIAEPMGETTVAISYYEIAGASPLPRQIDVVSPMLGELNIALHDYALDGKKVAGTERKDAKKPETPAPAKPAEPLKPSGPEKK
jgi:hypothetical protein